MNIMFFHVIMLMFNFVTAILSLMENKLGSHISKKVNLVNFGQDEMNIRFVLDVWDSLVLDLFFKYE